MLNKKTLIGNFKDLLSPLIRDQLDRCNRQLASWKKTIKKLINVEAKATCHS